VLKLGPECVLTTAYVGGSGTVTRGQRCVLELGNTTTALTVTSGTLSEVGSTVDMTVSGVTFETPQRFVTFHFAAAEAKGSARPSCNDVVGRPPAANGKAKLGSSGSRGRVVAILDATWALRSAPSSE
jgi:hypothetical protein